MAQLISNLPVGSKVKFGRYSVESEVAKPIVWQIADKNHTGYPANSITLLTDKIIDLRAFDAQEPSNADANRRSYGNNRYLHSNIRQWLNKGGHSWHINTHSADAPPTDAATNNYGTGYDDKNGFLDSFDANELSAILDTTLTVAKNTVTDGGGSETVIDKVFLPSSTEVGFANENNIVEGVLFPIFTSDASRISKLTAQAYENSLSTSKPATADTAWHYWLRTPNAGFSHNARLVYSSGVRSTYYSFLGLDGVRPALNLKSDIFVSDAVDSDGAYVVTFNEAPIITVIKKTYPDISFTTTDNDGTVQSARVLINGVEKKVFGPTEVSGLMMYSINLPDLNEGDNLLKIEATDDKGGIGTNTLTVSKASKISLPSVGSKLLIGGEEYEVASVADGGLDVTLTLDRGLEKEISSGEGIVMLSNYAVPSINIGGAHHPMSHIFTKEKDGKLVSEYQFNGDAREFQLKLSLKKAVGSSFEVEQPKAIFAYKGD